MEFGLKGTSRGSRHSGIWALMALQDPVPIVSWSCFYDASNTDSGVYFVSSAPTFHATKAALAAVLLHFQWKYVVLVVEESQRFYVDLAAHVTFSITDDQNFAIERFVHLTRDVTVDSAEQSLKVITSTHARGTYYRLYIYNFHSPCERYTNISTVTNTRLHQFAPSLLYNATAGGALW